jgi:hypothetical protein
MKRERERAHRDIVDLRQKKRTLDTVIFPESNHRMQLTGPAFRFCVDLVVAAGPATDPKCSPGKAIDGSGLVGSPHGVESRPFNSRRKVR